MKSSPQPTSLLQAAEVDPLGLSRARRIRRSITRLFQPSPSSPMEALGVGRAGKPYSFHDTKEGSGAFGHWGLDAEGLPVYRYTMNQRLNIAAYYLNTGGLDRRDHWHQIGNDRITALVSNDGIVQCYLADRGGIFLNHFDAYQRDPHSWPNFLKRPLESILAIVVVQIGRILAAWIRFRSRSAKVPRGATTQQQFDAKPECQPAPLELSNLAYIQPSPNDEGSSEEFAFAGGFGYLDDSHAIWATAFRYGPYTAKSRRVFGMGYFETEMTYRKIRQTRRVYAPYRDDPNTLSSEIEDRTSIYAPDGDVPIMLVDVEIENKRDEPVRLRYYEYWDVNIHQLQVQWIRTGAAARYGNRSRFRINERFSPTIDPIWQPDRQVLRFRQRRKSPEFSKDEQIGEVDPNPPGVFLANLSLPATDYYVDKWTFFGKGGVRNPDAVRQRLAGSHSTSDDYIPRTMPYCMVLRHDLQLKPGETVKLRYSYGALSQPDVALDFLEVYRQGDWLKQTQMVWKRRLAYFTTGHDFTLQREMAWHAYYLLSATVYGEFYKTHYTPQGSAYLYLHGADGAPRDQALFTLPLVYLCPTLALGTLHLLMRLQDADTLGLPYSFVGHGRHDNAMGIHAAPSDLDLFLLLAIAEYLAATGDSNFLSEEVPFYLPTKRPTALPGITVLDHIRAAMQHLTNAVGIGDHGLLKIGDGDWDDAVITEAWRRSILRIGGQISREYSICHGESVPNSQMAIYVLPLLADLVERLDPTLASNMRNLEQRLRLGLSSLEKKDDVAWNVENGWFNRALLRNIYNETVVLNDNHISLQSQPWALISGLAADMGVESRLIETVNTLLDDPSPTGAMLADKGQVWPAVSQLLTWGYRRSHPRLAWRLLNRHTFATHATVFPKVWSSTWSGPDGTNSYHSPDAGGTWESPATPMRDFPSMNANQNAMALLGLLRVCGIEPCGDGLLLQPKSPPEHFVLDLPLLYLEVAPGRIAGRYRAFVNGSIVLHICVPNTARPISARVGEEDLQPDSFDISRVKLPLTFKRGQVVHFEVRWAPSIL